MKTLFSIGTTTIVERTVSTLQQHWPNDVVYIVPVHCVIQILLYNTTRDTKEVQRHCNKICLSISLLLLDIVPAGSKLICIAGEPTIWHSGGYQTLYQQEVS